MFLIPFIAWISVHIIAIFGIFIAVIYPIWWLFSPTKRTPCLYCYFKSEAERELCVCSLGRNLLLIFLFMFISVLLVYGESRLLFYLGFPPTAKTASFVIPSQNQYRLGEIFPMKIEIVGIKTPINVVQTDLSFNPDKVFVVEISTKDSFANLFIQKEINNDIGYARLTGGLPNPGYSSDRGFFGTVYFKGLTPGLVKIDFLPSSMILANDGHGTNILTEIKSVSYLILSEKINKTEEEMQKNLISSDTSQLNFFSKSPVLGAQTEKQIVKPQKNVLELVDQFTLDMWKKILHL